MDAQIAGVVFSPPALALLGLCIGSFLNVVIHRLPRMLERGWKLESAELLGVKVDEPEAITLSTPRSRCPSCGHQITWYENIPVLSWLWLRGRCSACKTRISARYPFIELLTAALFALVAWRFGPTPTALLWCGFVAVLVALAGIDWDTTFLPDNLTLPLLWAGLVASALGWTIPLGDALWGAVAGYLSLWSVYWLFKLTTGKEGMGYGDFKLLGALGAWLGWKMLPVIVLLSMLLVAMAMMPAILFARHGRDKPIPFGPYLAASGVIALLWGKTIVAAYLDFVL